jgi:hypothetical protein
MIDHLTDPVLSLFRPAVAQAPDPEGVAVEVAG